MARSGWVAVLVLILCCVEGIGGSDAKGQGTDTGKTVHAREYWRTIVKNHYAVPSGEDAFTLSRELSGYLGSTDPELRDDLAYSILYTWIAEQKKLSSKELLTLLPEWEANLRAGIGESRTDSVFKRAYSVICLAALAERGRKDPFMGNDQFRTLLEDGLDYLRDERDLRGFDVTKGWMHATAHTADLLAELARSRFFTKQDQRRVLEAIAQRLATADEVFIHGEQDRLANVAATIATRSDFDSQLWRSWIADIDKGDQAVFKDSPPNVQALERFENDSYFLQATVAEMSLRPATAASTRAEKAVLTILRQRSAM